MGGMRGDREKQRKMMESRGDAETWGDMEKREDVVTR